MAWPGSAGRADGAYRAGDREGALLQRPAHRRSTPSTSHYLGSRTTGNDGGSFLVAGPGWKGETPKGVKEVIRCETELALAVYRTQLFNPGDIDNVKKIQAGYKVQPLSAFLGTAAPKSAPAIDFIKPITHDEEKTSLQVLQHP